MRVQGPSRAGGEKKPDLAGLKAVLWISVFVYVLSRGGDDAITLPTKISLAAAWR